MHANRQWLFDLCYHASVGETLSMHPAPSCRRGRASEARGGS